MNQEYRNTLIIKSMKFVHMLFLLFVLIAVAVSIWLPNISDIPTYDNNDNFIHIVEITLFVVSLICLLVGSNWLKWMHSRNKNDVIDDPILVNHHIIRASLFEAIAIYGLILRLLGSSLYISLVFFLLSATFLLKTFPTEERWKEWKRK